MKSSSTQVLALRNGRASVATTWKLESPGHLVNKFTTFVRVIFTDQSDGKAQGSSKEGEAEGKEVDEAEDAVLSVSPSRASTEMADKTDEEGITASKITLPPLILTKQMEENPRVDDKELKGKNVRKRNFGYIRAFKTLHSSFVALLWT